MPTVISILNQKGGVGKTTLATHLAHALMMQFKGVLLVDADPQGSLRDWHDANEEESLPVIGLDRKTLATDLPTVTKGFGLVIIDGPAQVAQVSAAAVRVSDLVLIPVQPSPLDIWSCRDLVDVVRARQEVTGDQPKAAFVISRAVKNTRLSGEAASALAEYGLPVLLNGTTQRVAYPTAAAAGLTVLATEPDGPAAAEIYHLADEIMEMLNDDAQSQTVSPRLAG